MLFDIGKIRTLVPWLMLSFASLLLCKTSDKVSLSWRRNGDHLCFVCDVRNLSLGVSFEDPHGNTRGHCTAPIPNTVAGHCDSQLKQNIYNETTVLTIDRVDFENGLWKCSHGQNTNEYATASVSLSTDSKEQKPSGSEVYDTFSIGQRYKCTLLSLCFGSVVAQIIILGISIYVTRHNETGQQLANVWYKKFCTRKITFISWRVGIPLAINLMLPLLLMLIPGICEGKWWILVAFLGVVITGGFKRLPVLCCKKTSESYILNLNLYKKSKVMKDGQNADIAMKHLVDVVS